MYMHVHIQQERLFWEKKKKVDNINLNSVQVLILIWVDFSHKRVYGTMDVLSKLLSGTRRVVAGMVYGNAQTSLLYLLVIDKGMLCEMTWNQSIKLTFFLESILGQEE